MQYFANHLLGVEQGSASVFSDFQDGGVMWSGTGPREARKQVTFRAAFNGIPAVTVGISMWDLDSRTNLRADITAENVTATGFEIVFKTWGDTRVARIRADWLAIGEACHEDQWQVD